MANTYKNASVDLTTTSKTNVYTCPSETTAIVKSIRVTEDSGNNDTIAVELYDNSAEATFKLTGTLAISASTSTELLSAPLVLEESDIVKATAGTANRIHVIMSILQITRT
jgi:hypothetical protein